MKIQIESPEQASTRSRLALSAAVLALLSSTASAEISGTTGDHQQVAPPTGTSMPANDSVAFAWNERQGVVLASDIKVDAVAHGGYVPLSSDIGTITIPAGTRVSSHMIHAQSASGAAQLVGSTLFGEPVIAVIWSDELLDATDAVLGVPGTPYPTGTALRGCEELINQDFLTVGRRRLQADMDMTSVMDQVRVITKRTFAFSLDIGSDTALSDPTSDGNEVHDCGDLILRGFAPDVTTYWDDVDHVGLTFPDSANPAPFGPCLPPGLPSNLYAGVFDLDGYDEVGIDLRQHPQRPIFEQELEADERAGILGVERLVISFDDDGAPGWGACGAIGRMPVESLSPTGKTYGTTAGNDEVWNVYLDATATSFPLPVTSVAGARDEMGMHPGIALNPDAGQQRDDDVDALDYIQDGRWSYISVDHEGFGLTLTPSGIYLTSAGGAPVLVADHTDLGIPAGTDLDAFEFVWIPYGGNNQGPRALAVVFSVDQDDPQTPTVDESGQSADPTLNARDLYFSFLNGSRFLLAGGLGDDVDAIAAAPENTVVEPGTQYCAVNDNSTGGPSLLSGAGSSSLAAADLQLTASNAPTGMTSLFYFGPAAIELPFGHGFRCVGGQTTRMAIRTESGGIFTYDVDFATFGSTFGSLGTVNFQCWYRDVAAGSPFFNLSNGYSVIFIP